LPSISAKPFEKLDAVLLPEVVGAAPPPPLNVDVAAVLVLEPMPAQPLP